MAGELNKAILLMFVAPYLVFGSFAARPLPRSHRAPTRGGWSASSSCPAEPHPATG